MNSRFLCASAAAKVAAVAGTAIGQVYTITDDTTTANTRVGMDNWTVDGVNHMYNQWFWFRTDGMTNEARLGTLALGPSGTTDTDFDGFHDTLVLNYTGAGFSVQARFGLQGGAAGSRVSDITEQLVITNTSAAPRTFSFFQYTDFDLNNDIQDDLVQVLNANAVVQADFLSGTTVAETVFTPTFSLSEVNVFPATIGSLDDAGITTLNGSTGPLPGRQDYTWALQWNFTLNPGESFQISKDLQITPTPGAAALIGLGGLVGLRRRRR
jgi:hypothetical protein